MTKSKEEVNISELYSQECLLSKEDFMKKYNIKEGGLTQSEAEHGLKQLAPNIIKQAKPKRWYNYFLESLFTPFNIISLSSFNLSLTNSKLSASWLKGSITTSLSSCKFFDANSKNFPFSFTPFLNNII